MATPSRDLTVIYGSVTIGTGSEDSYQLINGWEITGSRLAGFVSFDVVVFGSTVSELDTRCETLKEEFRKRRTRLRLKIGSDTHKDFNPSDGVHQDSQAQFQEIDDEWWTRLSRHYRISVAVDYPPPEENGRTEQGVSLTHDDSQIKTLTISVQYNATSGGKAKDRYESDFDGYCTSVLAVFGTGLTFEKVGSDSIDGDFLLDNELRITRIYRELIVGQASDSLSNDSELVGFQYQITLGKNRPGDFVGKDLPQLKNIFSVVRLITIAVTCSTSVDKTVTQDLKTVYESKIRPFLIEKAKSVAGVSVIALIEEDPSFNFVNNTISVSMIIQGSIGGLGQVLQLSVSTIMSDDLGRIIVGAWDGVPESFYVVQGKRRVSRVVTESKLEIGEGNDLFSQNAPIGEIPDKGKKMGWITLNVDNTEAPTFRGVIENGSESFPVFQQTYRTSQLYIKTPKLDVINHREGR